MAKDLDKFIKGKLDDRSFDFKPAYWEDALRLIEEEEKKKSDRNGIAKWLLGLLLLVSLSGVVVYNIGKQNTANTLFSDQTQNRQADKMGTTLVEHNTSTGIIQQQNLSSLSENALQNKADINQHNKTAASTENVAGRNISTNKNNTNNLVNQNPDNNSFPENNTLKQHKSVTRKGNPNTTNSNKLAEKLYTGNQNVNNNIENKITDKKISNSIVANNTLNAIADNNIGNKNIDDETGNPIVTNNTINADTSNNIDNKSINSKINEAIANKNIGDETGNHTVINNTVNTDTSNNVDNKINESIANNNIGNKTAGDETSNSIVTNNTVNNSTNNNIGNKNINNETSNSIVTNNSNEEEAIAKDSVATKEAEEETPIITPLAKQKNTLGIYAASVINPTGIDARDIFSGLKIGAAGYFPLRNKFGLSATLLYNRRSGKLPYTKTSQIRHYSFDSEAKSIVLLPNAAHYIQVGTFLTYQYKKHLFGIGGHVDFLAAMRGGVAQSANDQNESTFKLSSYLPGYNVPDKSWIVSDNYKKLVPSLALMYQYQLGQFNFNLRTAFRVGKITQNEIQEVNYSLDQWSEATEQFTPPLIDIPSRINFEIGVGYNFYKF